MVYRSLRAEHTLSDETHHERSLILLRTARRLAIFALATGLLLTGAAETPLVPLSAPTPETPTGNIAPLVWSLPTILELAQMDTDFQPEIPTFSRVPEAFIEQRLHAARQGETFLPKPLPTLSDLAGMDPLTQAETAHTPPLDWSPTKRDRAF